MTRKLWNVTAAAQHSPHSPAILRVDKARVLVIQTSEFAAPTIMIALPVLLTRLEESIDVVSSRRDPCLQHDVTRGRDVQHAKLCQLWLVRWRHEKMTGTKQGFLGG